MNERYCVVLGDVVDSRKIDDRSEFRQTLARALSEVNDAYGETLHAPFSILKGVDEIGGVLSSVQHLASIQKTLLRMVHPEQIRIAAVVGEIDVNADAHSIADMDGPALSRADAVLSELESDGLTFRLHSDQSRYDELISDEINLLNIIRGNWSQRQAEIITTYERFDSQKQVADSLDISPQAVSNALRDSKAKRILGIESRLDAHLRSYPAVERMEEVR